MKKLILVLSVGTCMAGMGAPATYYWKDPVNGSWNTAANWCTDSDRTVVSTVVPGISEYDTVSFPVGAYTVSSLGTDLTVKSISVTTAGAAGNGVVLDIGGKTLSTTNTGAFICLNGSGPETKRDFAKPYTSFEFRNGTYDLSTSYIQMIVTPSANAIDDRRSCIIIGEDAKVRTRFFERFYNGSRVFVKDGGTLECSGSSALAHTLPKYPVATTHPFICVTGFQSRASLSGQLSLGTPGAGLYVLDGAEVTAGTLLVGAASNSTNCFVRIDNASLKVNNGTLNLGSVNATTIGSSIEIAGERARLDVRGGNGNGLVVYEGTGAHIDIDVPPDGFKDAEGNVTVPITAVKYNRTARAEGLENLGTTRLRIKAKEWARRHPLESITLILLDNTNYNATSDLAANAETDIRCEEGTVLVSAKDGNKIVLTAPPHRGLRLTIR